MTELEKIAYAKSFIDKLANGVNPIDNSAIPDGDVVNNVRLSRCFFYVSSLLEQMINEKSHEENKKEKAVKRVRFNPFEVPIEKFRFSDEPITLGEMHRRLDELVDLSKMRRIARSRIPIWLVNVGMLTLPDLTERKYYGHPTKEGTEIGISILVYDNELGKHSTLVFNREAQQFIIDHLGHIIKTSAKKTRY